jgi:hypothetical protein
MEPNKSRHHFQKKDQITCISPLPQSSLICKPPPPLILDGNLRYPFLPWPALPCSSRLHPLLAVSTEGQAGACLRPGGLGGAGTTRGTIEATQRDTGAGLRIGGGAWIWSGGKERGVPLALSEAACPCRPRVRRRGDWADSIGFSLGSLRLFTHSLFLRVDAILRGSLLRM